MTIMMNGDILDYFEYPHDISNFAIMICNLWLQLLPGNNDNDGSSIP